MVINLRMTASAGGFKNKEVGVLVADTARGIDIDQLPLSTLIYQIFRNIRSSNRKNRTRRKWRCRDLLCSMRIGRHPEIN
jgi:hypothetical protein